MSTIRSINKTSIAGGEGKTEKEFLDYLKNIYRKRESKHSITLCKNTKGGDPVHVAKKVMLECKGKHFDAMLLLLDEDRAKDYMCSGIEKEAKKQCSKDIRPFIPKAVKCIRVTPCIEGFFLDILKCRHDNISSRCKSQFSKLTPNNKDAAKLTEDDYQKLFPKELLEERRAQIPALELLIQYFEIESWDDFSKYFS